MTNKRAADAQPSDGFVSRQKKKRKPAAVKFRLANDPAMEQIRATTIKQGSHGRLGYQKMDTVRVAESPIVEELATGVEGAFITEEHDSPDYGIEGALTKEPAVTPKKKINTTSSKLQEWLSFRDDFFNELHRIDGRGDYHETTTCYDCKEETCLYHCRDCFGLCLLYCKECLVRKHMHLPLHRVEVWNGSFFSKSNLRDLGLRIQLGHGGACCSSPLPGALDFLVFDINGVHHVAVDFCDCRANGFVHKRNQLFRVGWFPATFDRPQTVFTLGVLKMFQELTLQGKTTLYDFYHCMLRITDHLKLDTTTNRDRYPEFHRVFRIWRNLKALKRAGRGLDPKGISATASGELVVECPACPHPGKNLPENWQTAPLALRFLYTLFLAVDANFKLKNKERGIKDFELDPGWGCYVESSRYFQHLDNHADRPEINSCGSDHDAIARANTAVPGYSVNGTALVLCSRHSVVRKNGVGDLPKGEKYCSIDYIILCTLIGITLARVVISYDIACQWSKGFWSRMLGYPDEMKLSPETSVEVGIPNWHVNGHGAFCRDNLSLNYIPGVGRTCGEDVETSWAHTNPLASSTREMGPGARRETLNDHWGGWNFGKIVGFRALFLKRFKDASAMMKIHHESYEKFASTFPFETIQTWTVMVEDWKKDHTKPSPYAEQENMTTLQDVRMELAREDVKNAAGGIHLPHETTPTSFLMKGLDLEEQQRTLQNEISQQKGQLTKKQMADFQEKSMTLHRRIEQWRQVQIVYTPAVSSLLVTPSLSTSSSGSSDVLDTFKSPGYQPLFLPSSIPTPLNQGHDVIVLAEKECRLRIAQADEALSDIRRGRRTITGLNQFKKFNISGAGNKASTRMRVLYNRVVNKINKAAERYCAARAALLILQPEGGDWSNRLRNLNQADIRGPGKATDDLEPVPNGRYQPSWIWLVPRIYDSDVDDETEVKFDESLRAEWAKTLARKERWEEEHKLIQEEMRRVIAYFAWKVEWWRNQACHRTCDDAALAEGLQAYAAKQVSILESLADSSIQVWLPALKQEGISPEWAIHFQTHNTPASETHDCVDGGEEVLDDSEVLNGDDEICNKFDLEDF